MTERIENIALILGISRDGRPFDKRKRPLVVVRRERDTVIISTEARRLLADDMDPEDAVGLREPEMTSP